jgi:hypothetical protein
MRSFMLALALLAATPAHASDKDIGPFIEALVFNMGLSFFCRGTLGIDAYEESRANAADALMPHMGYAPAIVFVNDLDEKLRNDPRRFATPPARRCYEMKGEVTHRVKLERARLELAE